MVVYVSDKIMSLFQKANNQQPQTQDVRTWKLILITVISVLNLTSAIIYANNHCRYPYKLQMENGTVVRFELKFPFPVANVARIMITKVDTGKSCSRNYVKLLHQ